jgi:hypothetical protein
MNLCHMALLIGGGDMLTVGCGDNSEFRKDIQIYLSPPVPQRLAKRTLS